MHGQTDAVVRESADLLYNLVVLWVHAGVHPDDVWGEMHRREKMFGIAEKLPKDMVPGAQRRKVAPKTVRKAVPKVASLEARRLPKRR